MLLPCLQRLAGQVADYRRYWVLQGSYREGRWRLGVRTPGRGPGCCFRSHWNEIIMTQLTAWAATEIVSRLARRDVSAVELTQAFLERIGELNPALNAVITINSRALEDARDSDQRLKTRSPARRLEGVPFVVK